MPNVDSVSNTNAKAERETALITGASSGIGLAFAELLAEKKCNLILVARSADRLNELAEKLQKRHSIEAHVIVKDLTQMSALEELQSTIKNRGLAVDYLINNAGFGEVGNFLDTSWEKEHRMIELNMTALTYLSKIFAQQMVARGKGRILNVASTAAFQPGPGMAVYFATKAYVLSFTEAIASELEDTGVTATALCPGPTLTEFQQAAGTETSRMFRGRRKPSGGDVAQFGYTAMMQGRPVAVHGILNRLATESLRLMPRKVVTKLVKRMTDTNL